MTLWGRFVVQTKMFARLRSSTRTTASASGGAGWARVASASCCCLSCESAGCSCTCLHGLHSLLGFVRTSSSSGAAGTYQLLGWCVAHDGFTLPHSLQGALPSLVGSNCPDPLQRRQLRVGAQQDDCSAGGR